MTPQLLIVRIQALLGGRTEMSPMQKRSLAMEYYRQCSEAEAQVEHCISLLKAGREYAALQAAEASSLLDSINALLFEDLDKWREYCQAEGFPVPVPFDYSQIEQIAALYSKGITQAHPLYRDYRRAMRMRNYQKALSIIRTITKINAFDAAAKREYDKLRKHVAEEKMPALADALKAGDNEKIVELLDSIGNDSDAVASNPTWIAAVERRRAFEAASAKKRMREILSELERVDPANDWERALELVTEANLLRGDVELGAAEVEVLENYLKTASARHDEILAAEKASEARNLLLIEMEQPSKGSARKKLAKVSKLRKAADPVLEGELRGVIDARVKKLRLMALASAAVYVAATAIAVVAVVSLSYIGIDSFERARAEAKARGELAAIEALWDISAIESRLQEFEENHPELSKEQYFADKIEKIRGDASVAKSGMSRLDRIIGDLENMDYDAADSAAFDAAKSSLDKLHTDVLSMSQRDQVRLKESLDKIEKNLNGAIEARRLRRSTQMRAALDGYEKLLEKYDSFSGDKQELDEEFNSIMRVLRPLLDDVSTLFKAHQIDVDRFNDLTARMTNVRAKYAKFDMWKKNLMDSRTADEYVSALDSLAENPGVPVSFARKLSKIAAEKNAIVLGQLAELGIDDIKLATDMPNGLARVAFPANDLLVNVYRYSRGNRGYVYTLGPIEQKVQAWNTGRETQQEAKEITIGGKTVNAQYRQNIVTGKEARGEILTDGGITVESLLGANLIKEASGSSILSALTMLHNTKVNPAYKIYWEGLLYKALQKDPAKTGLAYSPSAKDRADIVERYAKGSTAYSWIFEKTPRLNLLEAEAYAGAPVNYEKEALDNKAAIKAALKNPIFLIGICDENGAWQIFKDNIGAIWAVDASTGKFRRFDEMPGDNDIAPLSPIFSEAKDLQAIRQSVTK